MRKWRRVIAAVVLLLFVSVVSVPALQAEAKAKQVHDVNVLLVCSRPRFKSGPEGLEELFRGNHLAGYRTNVNTYYYSAEGKSPSSRKKLEGKLEKAYGKSGDMDVNVLYYTGHTILNESKTMFGMQLGKNDSYEYSVLARTLAKYKGKFIVIMDTCYAESFYTKGLLRAKKEKKLTQAAVDRFTVLCSNNDKKKTYGIKYTKSILKSVKNGKADSNRDGTVTAGELHKKAMSDVKKKVSLHGSLSDFKLFQQAYLVKGSKDKTIYTNQKDQKLKVKIKNNYAKEPLILWAESDDNKILNVESRIAGTSSAEIRLTPKKAGTAKVKVYLGDLSRNECQGTAVQFKVTVKKASLTLDADKLDLAPGETTALKATVAGAKKTVTWKSSNQSVVTVKKGKVKAVNSGTATITASANGMTAKCTVTVKDADAKADPLIFRTTDGGALYQNCSNAEVRFLLDASSRNVRVTICSESGAVVYTKDFADCKKDSAYSFQWGGRNESGQMVPAGSYYAEVKAGSVVTRSKVLKVEENPFAGGNGTAGDPFQIATLEQLKRAGGYPDCCFVQTSDIDGQNGAMRSPVFIRWLSGSYDGGGHTIRNLNLNSPVASVFGILGKSGVIRNVNLTNIYISGRNPGGIVSTNSGLIEDVKLTGMRIENTDGYDCGGGLCCWNYGTIKRCLLEDSFLQHGGGIVDENYGTVECCTILNLTFTDEKDWADSGLAIENHGTFAHCTVSGLTIAGRTGNIFCYKNYFGAVISNCSFSNVPKNVPECGRNAGTIF